jgi:hypothetical protein
MKLQLNSHSTNYHHFLQLNNIITASQKDNSCCNMLKRLLMNSSECHCLRWRRGKCVNESRGIFNAPPLHNSELSNEKSHPSHVMMLCVLIKKELKFSFHSRCFRSLSLASVAAHSHAYTHTHFRQYVQLHHFNLNISPFLHAKLYHSVICHLSL